MALKQGGIDIIILWIVLICIAAIIILFLFCIAPKTGRSKQLEPYEQLYIAHRGLFDNESSAPENSIRAFQKAVDAGYGIELDVQMTTDGRLVVFHDESLKRMCGVDRILTDCSLEELKALRLADSEAGIPLLSDVLAAIGGKVPVIIEIKSDGDWLHTTELTAKMLDRYEGRYCIESFHPLVVRWFRRHRPAVIRGQLSTNYFKDDMDQPRIISFLLTNLLLNFLSRPDFIAYNQLWSSQWGYRICRRLFRVVNAAWTIQSPEDMERAKENFEIIIFDGFLP